MYKHILKILPALLGLSAGPAFGLDLRKHYVWFLTDLSEGPPHKIGLVKKDPNQRRNHFDYVNFTCEKAEDLTFIVGPVDPKPLGRAISSNNKLPRPILTIDGKDFDPYEATIFFNLHDEHWEYEAHSNVTEVKALANARTISIQGLGVKLDLPLPASEDITQFAQACEALSRKQ